MRLSRRQTIAGLVGGAVVAGTGAVTLAAFDESDLLRAMLHRLVGPFRMKDEDFAAFRAGIERRHGFPGTAKTSLYALAEAAGARPLIDRGPAGPRREMADLERVVLAEFVTHTDYLKQAGRDVDLTYLGRGPCSSPYAKFGMA
ncbi:hypothetical protein PQ455_01700 [Sphingomonas naphthae]|uniref:Gluconate 2-dehydrogenase subunit 3 family protein n=1 Tax=Sphingomonas naphthae TaxID=1813468 RepID=A0ABY7TQ45_9SPHN|nr:hypothetical protein [Sphingomonas naphthae]WCT73974.1 hypothetical protein PQ455_01700 [Sphingomonas naphthae]